MTVVRRVVANNTVFLVRFGGTLAPFPLPLARLRITRICRLRRPFSTLHFFFGMLQSPGSLHPLLHPHRSDEVVSALEACVYLVRGPQARPVRARFEKQKMRFEARLARAVSPAIRDPASSYTSSLCPTVRLLLASLASRSSCTAGMSFQRCLRVQVVLDTTAAWTSCHTPWLPTRSCTGACIPGAVPDARQADQPAPPFAIGPRRLQQVPSLSSALDRPRCSQFPFPRGPPLPCLRRPKPGTDALTPVAARRRENGQQRLLDVRLLGLARPQGGPRQPGPAGKFRAATTEGHVRGGGGARPRRGSGAAHGHVDVQVWR